MQGHFCHSYACKAYTCEEMIFEHFFEFPFLSFFYILFCGHKIQANSSRERWFEVMVHDDGRSCRWLREDDLLDTRRMNSRRWPERPWSLEVDPNSVYSLWKRLIGYVISPFLWLLSSNFKNDEITFLLL